MASPEAEIAELVARYRIQEGKTLSIGTAESATGGKIADRLTSVAGSSEYFKGGVVSYSNEAKVRILKVKCETIEDYGAVSEQAAIEMAEGARKLLGVDVCVSDTGIAGPSGGSPGKPVGLFYVGLATNEGCLSQERVFSGNREENKWNAAEAALDMLRRHLLQSVLRGV